MQNLLAFMQNLNAYFVALAFVIIMGFNSFLIIIYVNRRTKQDKEIRQEENRAQRAQNIVPLKSSEY
jgi:hypothetical protein